MWTVNFTALDAEAFLVIDGPVEADGYTWVGIWKRPTIKPEMDWSAGDFLSPIEGE